MEIMPIRRMRRGGRIVQEVQLTFNTKKNLVKSGSNIDTGSPRVEREDDAGNDDDDDDGGLRSANSSGCHIVFDLRREQNSANKSAGGSSA
jgi:hypothetical protein